MLFPVNSHELVMHTKLPKGEVQMQRRKSWSSPYKFVGNIY